MSPLESDVVNRFIRFLLVGLLNTGFGYGVYAVFVLFGAPPQIALLMQFVIGAVWNYFTHARLVFDTTGYRKMPAYLGCYAGLYALNAALLGLLMAQGVGPLAAQAVILPLIVVLSFALVSRVLRGPGAMARSG